MRKERLQERRLEITNANQYIMGRKKKQQMHFGYKLGCGLLILAVILTLLQFVFKSCFGIDLGITFFGKEMF